MPRDNNPPEDLVVAYRASYGKVYDDEISDPKWGNGPRFHDWRNYVPEDLQKLWGRLGYETRLAVFMTAKDAADDEEWA